jgi:hypothetical protein
MSEQKHSPEPWRIHVQNGGTRYVDTLTGANHYDSDYIAVVGGAMLPTEENDFEDDDGVICDNAQYYAKPISAENARRIVACVNACAGIATQTLELTSVGYIKDHLDNYQKLAILVKRLIENAHIFPSAMEVDCYEFDGEEWADEAEALLKACGVLVVING